MNITSINSYNNTAFRAKSKGRFLSEAPKKPQSKPSKQTTVKPAQVIGGVGLAIAAVLTTIFGIPNVKTNQTPSQNQSQTAPSSSYTETMENIPSQDAYNQMTQQVQPIYVEVITTRPLNQRTPDYHTVKEGDRLADIVKYYAKLDQDTPDEKLIPYYELLEADNPGAWEDRNVIRIGSKIRVDAIARENINIEYINIAQTQTPDAPVEEPAPTQPEQKTSPEDTIVLNGLKFSFDLGTMKPKFGNDYEGLIFEQFVVLKTKMNGELEYVRYEGSNSDSNVAQKTTYDEDGKIIEVIEYKDNKPQTVSNYAYKTDSIVVTTTDKTAVKDEVDQVITTFDIKTGSINSRQFVVNKGVYATFDFVLGTATIGAKTWEMDFGSFVCNDDVIGSGAYTATIDGNVIRFDMLKNGYCVEYLDALGNIDIRQQFDTYGNLRLIQD